MRGLSTTLFTMKLRTASVEMTNGDNGPEKGVVGYTGGNGWAVGSLRSG